MIYSQIYVNFNILGKNEDDWAKGEYTKLKRESWNTQTLTKIAPNLQKANTSPVDLA